MVLKKELSRVQLYELVWSKPMRDAAADVGISDVGLKKRCRSQAVPVPPQGYWNKVHAGHRMPPRPTLPPVPETRYHPPTRPTSTEAIRQPKVAKTPERALRKENRRRGSKGGLRMSRRGFVETFYVMAIEAWDWDYSFGVSRSVHANMDIVTDYPHLGIQGTVLRPSALAPRSLTVTLIPDRRNLERYRETPEWIGFLRRAGRGTEFEAILPIPADMLASVLGALRGRAFLYIILTGEPMFRSQAGIRYYALRERMEPDDLPPE